MKKLLEKYPQIKYLLWFIPTLGGYFLSNHIYMSERLAIHSALDDVLPFIPAFSMFYVVWYLYVPLTMLLVLFTGDKKDFKNQCFAIFVGMAISDIVFFLKPTVFPFRPVNVPGITSLDTFFVNTVFSLDNPTSVCPSLHVFEAVILHLTTFRQSKLKNDKLLHILSLLFTVFVVFATMFIKQHSIIDAVYGIILAFIMYFFTYYILPLIRKGLKKHGKTEE